MPAVRQNTSHKRRRSSYGSEVRREVTSGLVGGPSHSQSPSPRLAPAVTFAPNVTPGTYTELTTPPDDDAASPPPSPSSSTLFPPSAAPAPAPSRRRVPPGKRPSQGYIPRPPNAFMLFRADFVRQKHVPGSIETNHGSLSKIIGNCWRALPQDEKAVWEAQARRAKAEHKRAHPDYKFKPVHTKNRDRQAAREEREARRAEKATPEEERRCEEVAQLLLEGKKGAELAAAVRQLDERDTLRDRGRARTPAPAPVHHHPYARYHHRRSSSVPAPGGPGITLPSAPFLALNTLAGTSFSMSPEQRASLGARRASSARPYHAHARAWNGAFDDFAFPPPPAELLRDESPLPDADTSLFDPSFFHASPFASGNGSADCPPQAQAQQPYSFSDMYSSLPAAHAQQQRFTLAPGMGMGMGMQVSPLDTHQPIALDPSVWTHPHLPAFPMSGPASASGYSTHSSPYTPSPALSDVDGAHTQIHAPVAQHPGAWKPASDETVHATYAEHAFDGAGVGAGVYDEHFGAQVQTHVQAQDYAAQEQDYAAQAQDPQFDAGLFDAYTDAHAMQQDPAPVPDFAGFEFGAPAAAVY